MTSKSILQVRALAPILLVVLIGCGSGGAPSAAPTSTSTAPPATSSAPPSATAAATARPTKTPGASTAGEENMGVYETEVGSTIELLEDGTCDFQTTKGTLAGCRYTIRGSNIQFSADDGSQFAYIFANGCIYGGKIGTEDHATFCKK